MFGCTCGGRLHLTSSTARLKKTPDARWTVIALICSYKVFLNSLRQCSTWIRSFVWASRAWTSTLSCWRVVYNLATSDLPDCSGGSAFCAWVPQSQHDKTVWGLEQLQISRSLHLGQLFALVFPRKLQELQRPLSLHRHPHHHLHRSWRFHVLPEKIQPLGKEDRPRALRTVVGHVVSNRPQTSSSWVQWAQGNMIA